MPETYAQVAPDQAAWPTLVDKVRRLDLDFEGIPAEAVAGMEAPTLVVVGDSDIVRPDHAVELFTLLGGGVNGDVEGDPDARLAVLPGTRHIGVVTQQAESLRSMVSAFLDADAADAG